MDKILIKIDKYLKKLDKYNNYTDKELSTSQDFKDLLEYQIKPFIEETSELNKLVQERKDYFCNLSKDTEFTSLKTNLDNLIREICRFVDIDETEKIRQKLINLSYNQLVNTIKKVIEENKTTNNLPEIKKIIDDIIKCSTKEELHYKENFIIFCLYEANKDGLNNTIRILEEFKNHLQIKEEEKTIQIKPYNKKNNAIKLTDKEIEYIKLLGKGRTDKEIAQLLRIAVSTVRSRYKAVAQKLEASNRTELAILAKEQKII
jgi:DNA-binding CsgD family transcriptional regulator